MVAPKLEEEAAGNSKLDSCLFQSVGEYWSWRHGFWRAASPFREV